MTLSWNHLNLQAKFTLIIGTGITVLAIAAVAAIGYIQYSSIEQKLRGFSENELQSLNSLVESAMVQRFDDPQNVAIKVFNGWFESRNKDYAGKLWSAWGPNTAAYMAKTAPDHAAKRPLDAIDEEALRTGEPIGRFVNDTYRYSMPIVMGRTRSAKEESCQGCHRDEIGDKDGNVISVFSSSLSTTAEFAAMRQQILFTSLGGLAGVLLIIFLTWSIFGRVVARPVRNIAAVLGNLTNDRIVDVPYANRNDEVGEIAKATEIFKQSVAGKIVNLRVRSGLDVVRSNVMIADPHYDIMYMNDSMQGMFRDAETELRKALPAFNADKLIGANMDVFHRNPAHQRKMLDELTGNVESHITVGSQKFHLVATPVLDQHHKRAGTVIEWRNETAEIAIETEVADVVGAAVAGDFSKRVPLDGKSGFMLTLSGAMNGLCENVAAALDDLLKMLSALAGGDLTRRITADYEGAFAQLKNDANAMAERIGSTIGQIKQAAREVTSAAVEISTSTTDLSQRTEEQAASLEQTSASMEEISATVKRNAENAEQAAKFAGATREVAEHGGTVVSDAVAAMARIEESSHKIADIIGVIDEIARQTNLLALNAAVEAARAGDAGRGFAVVATEVRSLAQRSAQAAKDINNLISNSSSQVKDGVDLVNRTGASLTEIVASIKKVADIVSDIAAASAEQTTGLEQINKALAQMDEVTQQNSALVEENAASAKTLEHQAAAMDERVGTFVIGDIHAADEPHPRREEERNARSAPAASRKRSVA